MFCLVLDREIINMSQNLERLFRQIKSTDHKWSASHDVEKGVINISFDREIMFRIYENTAKPNTYFLLGGTLNASSCGETFVLDFLDKIMAPNA